MEKPVVDVFSSPEPNHRYLCTLRSSLGWSIAVLSCKHT